MGSYIVVPYVFGIFDAFMKGVLLQRYVMSLTLTEGKGGGLKKVHVVYFLCGTLGIVCIHSPEYSAQLSVFA